MNCRAARVGRQVKARAEVGAITVLIRGAATPAAAARIANFFIICRLDRSIGASEAEFSISRRRRKRSIPTLTRRSPSDASRPGKRCSAKVASERVPSQCRQIAAALPLRQWARLLLTSKISNSPPISSMSRSLLLAFGKSCPEYFWSFLASFYHLISIFAYQYQFDNTERYGPCSQPVRVNIRLIPPLRHAFL